MPLYQYPKGLPQGFPQQYGIGEQQVLGGYPVNQPTQMNE